MLFSAVITPQFTHICVHMLTHTHIVSWAALTSLSSWQVCEKALSLTHILHISMKGMWLVWAFPVCCWFLSYASEQRTRNGALWMCTAGRSWFGGLPPLQRHESKIRRIRHLWRGTDVCRRFPPLYSRGPESPPPLCHRIMRYKPDRYLFFRSDLLNALVQIHV